MADNIKSGGTEFPLENPRHLENGDLFKQFTGMSLRQCYAGQALAGIASREPDLSMNMEAAERTATRRAAGAFFYADAMIALEANERKAEADGIQP